MLSIGRIPTGATSWSIKLLVRVADTATSGTLTVRGLYRYLLDSARWTVPAAITFSSSTEALAGDGGWEEMTISGTVANLGSAAAGDDVELCIIRDVSEDSIAEVIHAAKPELSWA